MEKTLKQIINPENEPMFFGITKSDPQKDKKLELYLLKQQPGKDYLLINCEFVKIDGIIQVEVIDEYIFFVTTKDAIYLIYKYF